MPQASVGCRVRDCDLHCERCLLRLFQTYCRISMSRSRLHATCRVSSYERARSEQNSSLWVRTLAGYQVLMARGLCSEARSIWGQLSVVTRPDPKKRQNRKIQGLCTMHRMPAPSFPICRTAKRSSKRCWQNSSGENYEHSYIHHECRNIVQLSPWHVRSWQASQKMTIKVAVRGPSTPQR